MEREAHPTDARQLRTPVRVLTVLKNPILAEAARMALSHGQFVVRSVSDESQATKALDEWHPHIAIIDMDVVHGKFLDHLMNAPTSVGRVPSIALTHRGDLSTKLAAFEGGAEDIFVAAFSPTAVLSRTL